MIGWMILALVCFALALRILFDTMTRIDPEKMIAECEEEFRSVMPDLCARCSYNRWASSHGYPLAVKRPHDCVERRGGRHG